MATCKDCLHKCYTEDLTTEETCNFFLDKAEYVPVVRCKDCVHWYDREEVCLKIYSDGTVSPYAWQFRGADDFCSYGERRESDGFVEVNNYKLKCPCGLRSYMEEDDCSKTKCNDCCPLSKEADNGHS